MENANRETSMQYNQQLVTVVIGKWIPVQLTEAKLKTYFEELTHSSSGHLIHFGNQIFIATFKAPSKAVNYGLQLKKELATHGLQIAAGIHIKECNNQTSINDQTIDIVSSMLNKVELNHVLISDTIRQLLPDRGLVFASYMNIFEPISNEVLPLFKVSEDVSDQWKSECEKLKNLNSPFINLLVKIVNANIDDETLSVDQICREIGVSERQLQRKLKQLTNKSPWQFITCLRLNKAKEMLLSRQGNVSEIAFQTGFSNPSYFAKRFKEKYGVNPSNFTVERKQEPKQANHIIVQ